MNLDLIFIILFYGLIFLYFITHRKDFEVQSKIFALYRTKLGLKLMDSISRFKPRFLKVVGYIAVFTGFSGMIVMLYFLFKGAIDMIIKPGGIPTIAPVLPGVHIPGLPTLSFWHWIIAIFIVAAVHEFSHGVIARLYNIKITSSGFAFLGPILGAFVEPDEKSLKKKNNKAQLSVFSAGPFANVILGLLFLLIFSFVFTPIQNYVFEPNGIIVNQVESNYPASSAGIKAPFTIYKINNDTIKDAQGFLNSVKDIKPGQKLTIETNKGIFNIITTKDPQNATRGFIGISDFALNTQIKDTVKTKYGDISGVIKWFSLLLFWLVVINLGVGLFNLLPLGPLDGGRMFQVFSGILFKNKNKANRFFVLISWLGILLILINLWPYISKLLMFFIKPFLG
ncbi:MAG: site-2 protease family protein [Candidatus Woesearchaeota archaeon]|nr:site-2 protease family protein [Candidatus Woesearchaeota archaeon]